MLITCYNKLMKICIPIKEKDLAKVNRRLLEASERADLAEIWLDQLNDADIENLISKAPLPIVAVCKRKTEKGDYIGSYEDQSQMLIKAIKSGASYVDIPLYMPDKLNKKIVQESRKNGVKVIISHHDFKKTPSYMEMLKMTSKMLKKGADIVKIAVKSQNLQDAIQLISVGKMLKTPHILIGMGQKGILTRILTPTLGGEMMFAVMSKKGQTAEGQISVSELKNAWKLIKAK